MNVFNIRNMSSERYKFGVSVALSIVLHIIVLLLTEIGVISLSNNMVVPAVQEEEKRLAFEIVESLPENAVETPPEDAVLASDKNTRARDINPETMGNADNPYIEGFAETKELPVPPASMRSEPQTNQFVPLKKFNLSELIREAFSAENEEQDYVEQEKASRLQPVMPDNQYVSTRDIGNMSLSTYAWDFAPYMLRLKRKIERNIQPPPAFTELGVIDGTFVLQFVITRKGELKLVQLLDSRGSSALERTSFNAVNYSAPFDPLPEDFPEELLTITGTFHYYIIK